MKNFILAIAILTADLSWACECTTKVETAELRAARFDADEAVMVVKEALRTGDKHWLRFEGSSMMVLDLGDRWEVRLSTVANRDLESKQSVGRGLVFEVEKKTHRIICSYLVS